MSLTAQQLEQRTRGVGASEVAALAGLNRFSDPIKVWALKRRGEALDVDPLIPPDDPEVVSQRGLGHVFEPILCDLYSKDEGNEGVVLLPCHTLVHARHSFIMATPDRLVYPDIQAANDGTPLRGLETKLVGRYMAIEWDDGVPDDVVIQCQQNMSVTGLDRWDVAALVGGTDFQVHTVWRDDEVIDALTAIVHAFWCDHILADVMPEIGDAKHAMTVLRAKWSIDNGEEIEAPPEAAPLAARLAMVRLWLKEGTKAEDTLKAELVKLLGANKKMKAPWGSFSSPTVKGGVQWKKVAMALVEGLTNHLDADDETILAFATNGFTSDAYRKPGFYPKRAKKVKKK